MLLQLGESSLQETQTMVQQEAGILLDRQRITIEGTHTLTYRRLQMSGCLDTSHCSLNTITHASVPGCGCEDCVRNYSKSRGQRLQLPM